MFHMMPPQTVSTIASTFETSRSTAGNAPAADARQGNLTIPQTPPPGVPEGRASHQPNKHLGTRLRNHLPKPAPPPPAECWRPPVAPANPLAKAEDWVAAPNNEGFKVVAGEICVWNRRFQI